MITGFDATLILALNLAGIPVEVRPVAPTHTVGWRDRRAGGS